MAWGKPNPKSGRNNSIQTCQIPLKAISAYKYINLISRAVMATADSVI